MACEPVKISESDLVEFILSANENEPALTQIRMALAGWDSLGDYSAPAATETPPRTTARRSAIYLGLDVSNDLADALSERVKVFKEHSTVISKVFEPWYEGERKHRSSVYWDHYESYLRQVKQWPASSVASLDKSTAQVVERLSRPTRDEAKRTKGLVVGYVQSGKTANFTGVAAKAIDVGYRLVIVLTGTIEILRAQTQRRMDMELMGVENILAGQDPEDPAVAKELDYQQDEDWLNDRFVRHGDALAQPGVVEISRVTSHHSDYKRLPMAMTKLRFARKNKQKPLNDEENLFHSGAYVAVIKKNSAPLNKLIQDLKPLKKDLAELPVLIIDDESDQASVDTTNPNKWKKGSSDEKKRTTINRLITEILELCPRAQYVGYTATPFANVFVDPDDERDLFPADFVLSLHRPPGYMGVQEFHDVGKRWDDESKSVANSNELAYVRPLKGDPDSDAECRDRELQEALDAWVLSGAIKMYRETESDLTFRHHTMLVHESVKKNDHAETAEDVRRLWRLTNFTSSAGLSRLAQLFEKDFHPVMSARALDSPIPETFDKLRPFVADAIAEMTHDGDPVLILNSDKEIQAQQKKLDFETQKVWRILVGGTQLSRGFTVEGLTISYFRRKAGQADTLMQAGRWFGFRPGYRDLVRLYIRRDARVDLYEAFEALLLDEEAFRAELRQYEGFDENGMPTLEPRQIPPLVSQHLPWLKPTARTKMWNARIVDKAPTDIQDLYGLPGRGDIKNRQNFDKVIVPLLRHTKFKNEPQNIVGQSGGETGGVSARVGTISAREFLDLFEKLQWHDEYRESIDIVRRFLRNATDTGKIVDWAVVWPVPAKTARTVNIPELGGEVPVVKRKRRSGRIDFIGSDPKHRSAVRPITHGEPVAELDASATRGVVLVYLVPDRDSDDSDIPVASNELVGLLAIGVPSASVTRSNLIRWAVENKSRPEDVVVEHH